MSLADRASALRRVAGAERLLVACDFDGTLAPLGDEPMAVRMLPAARAAVDELTRLPGVWVALVSGRSLVDLEVIAEHDPLSPLLLAGSHGAEYWFPGAGAIESIGADDDTALRDRLRAHARAATGDLEGIWIEPKTFGFGVHTRRATPAAAEEANARVDALVRAEAPHWRRRTGHSIVEYAFRHEGKDTAVAHLRERLDATCVLFAGDDVTDEDALQSLGPDDLGVHIGAGPTAATLCLPEIPAFAAFLHDLARTRAAASHPDTEE
ncbi:MAG: trehalose-phosphatase [Microbacterium sp.]|uniref:trehalose-phosphatase n=1 Tax=Microbacterium sp. TaxID=51671 RepID=UPI003A8C8730